jgi:hypothetical protein
VNCAKCGADNREGRKFCAKCAAPLARLCPRCGAQNEPDEDFCGECAAPLAETPGQPRKRTRRTGRGRRRSRVAARSPFSLWLLLVLARRAQGRLRSFGVHGLTIRVPSRQESGIPVQANRSWRHESVVSRVGLLADGISGRRSQQNGPTYMEREG